MDASFPSPHMLRAGHLLASPKKIKACNLIILVIHDHTVIFRTLGQPLLREKISDVNREYNALNSGHYDLSATSKASASTFFGLRFDFLGSLSGVYCMAGQSLCGVY